MPTLFVILIQIILSHPPYPNVLMVLMSWHRKRVGALLLALLCYYVQRLWICPALQKGGRAMLCRRLDKPPFSERYCVLSI